MTAVIHDDAAVRSLKAERKRLGIDRWDEVWEGVYVVPTLPNDEHQEIQLALGSLLFEVVQTGGLGKVRAGVNVTDRHPDWEDNFRGPDLVAYLNSSKAVNYGTHWLGGPDFLVEIISPREDPTAKFDFYASVKSREVLLVLRDPWAVELHQLRGKKLVRAGRSEVATGTVLTSGVVALSFRLVAGAVRPRIEVTHTATNKTWLV